MQADADYYARLPMFDGFASVMDPARYQPLPDDWMLGLTDVVSSTNAIEEGRYKAVNTAGASVIAGIERARKPQVSLRVRRRWRELRGLR